MKRLTVCLLVSLVSLLGLVGSACSQVSGPKLVIHIEPHASKERCATASPNATQTPCSEFVTCGLLNTSYDAYIVLANVPSGGTRGATFAIRYDGERGSGIDTFGWVGCADLEFPGNDWPDPEGGTVAVWNECQMEDVGGEGVMATVGSFYTYAYSTDYMRITKRNYVPIPDLQWADCSSGSDDIDAHNQAGFAAFGSEHGCNPCIGLCDATNAATADHNCAVPVEESTWGDVKRLFEQRDE